MAVPVLVLAKSRTVFCKIATAASLQSWPATIPTDRNLEL